MLTAEPQSAKVTGVSIQAEKSRSEEKDLTSKNKKNKRLPAGIFFKIVSSGQAPYIS